MSRDVGLAYLCPHVIAEERVSLGTDRRTLYTSKPISGPNLVQVVANNSYIVSPYTGLVTAASVKSYRKEPYKVTLANHALLVTTQVGSVLVGFSQGYLSASQVATAITAQAGNLVMAEVQTGYVVITDIGNPGPSSKVQLSGSALEALGFDFQSGDKGRMVVPSWKLYARSAVNPQDAVDSLGYYVGFDAPVKQGMYFTVTYTVAPNHCLRCLTTEVENDYRFDAQGNALMVQNENLLYQSCLKIILTALQSNIYYPWYGSTLTTLIGSKVVGGTVGGIRQSVNAALTTLQNLQATQSKYQRITAKERLFSVDNVSVNPSPSDPTVYFIEVSVRNYSSEVVDISIVYTAPGTFALPGTNQLSLGSF
jgi:hypothetical protein